ncbi:PDIL2-1 [Symbiodinium sp. CCMP2456]|nr:PDIL2-1 [Symbiodinium sp. CCMP2456]
MFQDAMVSVEAHVAAKLQVEGVFGDLQMLKGQLMKSIESRPVPSLPTVSVMF